MNLNNVGALYPSNFGGFLLASVQNCSIGATGDVTPPGKSTAGIGIPAAQYRVRKIVVRSPLILGVSGNASAGFIGFWDTAAQGGNNLVANAQLSSLTTNLTYQEMTLTAAANTTILTSSTIFPNVGTAVTNGTVDIDIYGDIIKGRE